MDDQIVPFTVKELLQKIDGKMDDLMKVVESKADLRKFEEVEKRVAYIEQHGTNRSKDVDNALFNVENRVKVIENSQISEETLRKYQMTTKEQNTRFRFIAWGLIVSIFTSLISMAGVIISFLKR